MGESRITPSGIINDAVSMIGKMNDSSFPIDVFPNKIRNIILNMYEYLAFPIDYTACSMMTAISTCIGNTHILHFKAGWDIKCIIYMALVGRPGANKSHPLKRPSNLCSDLIRSRRKYITKSTESMNQ